MGVPYRKASRYGMVWLVMCLAGVAGQIAVMAALHPFHETLKAWVVVPGGAAFVLAIFIAVIVTRRLRRGRYRRIGERLHPLGYEFNGKPSDEDKVRFFVPYDPLKVWMFLNNGATGVEWFATLPDEQGDVRLFEHEFTTGSGRTLQIHVSTVVSWPAGRKDVKGAALGSLAGFYAGRPFIGTKRMYRAIALKEPDFERALEGWVFTGTVETGRKFLTPPVLGMLADAPRGESWFIGGGMVTCLYKHPLDEVNLPKFIERARTVFSLAS